MVTHFCKNNAICNQKSKQFFLIFVTWTTIHLFRCNIRPIQNLLFYSQSEIVHFFFIVILHINTLRIWPNYIIKTEEEALNKELQSQIESIAQSVQGRYLMKRRLPAICPALNQEASSRLPTDKTDTSASYPLP
jgi:hypothetical protein